MPEINEEKMNRAILVGLNSPRLSRMDNATDSTMEELAALLETAGGESLGVVIQNKDVPDPGTFIGDGKVDEVRELVQASRSADLVIFDNDLSSQPSARAHRGASVCRSWIVPALILDIFAQRARTT